MQDNNKEKEDVVKKNDNLEQQEVHEQITEVANNAQSNNIELNEQTNDDILNSQDNKKKNRDKESKNEIKKGIAIGFSAFFGLIFIVLVSLLIAGFQLYYVITDSMSPTIYRGEMVIVNTNIDTHKLEVGDIVTFQKGTTTVTHRIVEVLYDANGNVYYMQAPDIEYRQMMGEDMGTNIMSTKSSLYPNEIVGEVVTIGGKPIKLYILSIIVGAFRGAGILNLVKLILGLAIAVLLLWTVIGYAKERLKKDQNDNKKE